MTMEISWAKSPSKGKIGKMWKDNKDALIGLPVAAMKGVRGTVKSATGAPLAATLYIKPASGPHVPFKADASFGFFARPLEPGKNYTLVATAVGYAQSEATFAVPAAGGVTQNFVLAAQG